MKYNSKLLLLLLFVCSTMMIRAQHPKEWNRVHYVDTAKNDFKVGSSYDFCTFWYGVSTIDDVLVTSASYLQYDRRITPWFDLGAYFALRQSLHSVLCEDSPYTVCRNGELLYDGPSVSYRHGYALRVGFDASFHLLKRKFSHWDPYANIRGGMDFNFVNQEYIFADIDGDGEAGLHTYDTHPFFEWSVGLGAAYRFSNHWGLFVEGGLGRSRSCGLVSRDRQTDSQLRMGLQYKW